MKKLIKNTIIETYCVTHCCQDTPKRAVHAEGGAVSINTKRLRVSATHDTDKSEIQPVSEPESLHNCVLSCVRVGQA